MPRTSPLGSHAKNLTGCIAATGLAVTAIAVAVPPGQARAWDFPSREIAQQAKSHPTGKPGGQCKVFAQRVVNEVLAKEGINARVRGYGTPGGAYYGAYRRAGGILVDPEAGRPGDLIQVITPRKKTSDKPPLRDKKGNSLLHSAIIVGREGPGSYVVRDSNYVASETVGQHHWVPDTWRKHGVDVYVWRFGERPRPEFAASAVLVVGAYPVDPPPDQDLRAQSGDAADERR